METLLRLRGSAVVATSTSEMRSFVKDARLGFEDNSAEIIRREEMFDEDAGEWS